MSLSYGTGLNKGQTYTTAEPPIFLYKDFDLKDNILDVLLDVNNIAGTPVFTDLTNKVYEFTNDGDILSPPSTNLVSSFKSVLLPPTMTVDLYGTYVSATECTEPLGSISGIVLQQSTSADINNITDPATTSLVNCLKITKSIKWDDFISKCGEGKYDANICKNFTSPGDAGSGSPTGDNKVPDKKSSPKNHTLVYAMIGVVTFLIIGAIIITVYYNSSKPADVVSASTMNKNTGYNPLQRRPNIQTEDLVENPPDERKLSIFEDF
jgi:hypothetical protein